VVKPLQKAVMDDWLKARGCEIVSENEDTVYVKVDSSCPNLKKSEDGWWCEIYYKRPEGCRIFDGTKYDFLKCAWKNKVLVKPTFSHVILEKAKK
jgi:Fe-S-cluster containining protein